MKIKELFSLERIKKNSTPNFTVSFGTMNLLLLVAFLNKTYGNEKIDFVYVVIILFGSTIHEKKAGRLGKLPKWLYYSSQTMLAFAIISVLVLSLFGDILDNWFVSIGL